MCIRDRYTDSDSECIYAERRLPVYAGKQGYVLYVVGSRGSGTDHRVRRGIGISERPDFRGWLGSGDKGWRNLWCPAACSKELYCIRTGLSCRLVKGCLLYTSGQGTIAMEIVKELPLVDYILVPIGGGGLATGVSTLAKLLNPKIKVIGVEPANANCMQRCL